MTEFRFKVGDKVWVKDKGHGCSGRGYAIVQATVRAQHSHPGRHPAYPNGEGYTLDGELWWDCYPGCRVAATRKEAVAIRLGNVGKRRAASMTGRGRGMSAVVC